MSFDPDVIGAGLPVRAMLPELVDALGGGTVVVQAPPGTGKTTLVPVAVSNHLADKGLDGRVVVTQPRRIAARAAARRVSQLAGTRVGSEVGHVVRGEAKISSATRVEFCTAGVMLRRLLNDPELDGIGAVVLDEVHERSLDSDLVFAMVAELRELRPELLLVVMSATLDAARWAELLGGAPVVAVEAERHPLEVRWAPMAGSRTDARGVVPAFLDHVAEQAACLCDAAEGDVLVFVPGAREVDRLVERLQGRGLAADALHGSLPAAEQDRVLHGNIPGQRRIVVATAIAESSLTVPGVRAVVDAGLSREPRVDLARGMSGLVTVSEARSSAEQRAGRAARLGPGIVVRCFSEDDWPRMRAHVTPEIVTSDLVQTCLDLACWGSPAGEGLALPDQPPAAAVDAATTVLQGLGALAADGRPTDLGRRLAAMPVEPRLGRALLDCAAEVGAREAAEVVAMLSGDERAPGGDLVAQLRDLRQRRPGPWQREASRLEALTSRDGRPSSGATGVDEAVARVVAAAWPDRIARRRGEHSSEYLTTAGTGVELPRDSRLNGASWLAIAEMGRVGDRAVVRAAVRLDEETALAAASGLRVVDESADWVDGKVRARRIDRLGAIELTSTPIPVTPELGELALRRALSDRGLRQVLDWGEGVEALRCRLALAHHLLGGPWPAMDDGSLVERADQWLAPELRKLASGTPAAKLDLVSALRRLLPWPEAGRLDELVPERIEVPTGSRIRLDYPDDPSDRVVLAVKLQECFGLTETPRIADGRVAVLMHLLSPAGRPLAVTDDLASFWVNAYPGVRAENRGRYIKHPWPEDPLTAPARRGTTRSGK